MKKWVLGCQIILGLIFIFAGINGLFVFFGLEPFLPTSQKAMEFFRLKYLLFFEKSTEVVLGTFLVWGRFVPLALAGLFPILVNIFAFHLFEDPALFPLAFVLMMIEVFLLWIYREYYSSMFTCKAMPKIKK